MVVLGVLWLCGCGGSGPQPKVVRLAYTAGPSELLHEAALRFAEQVKTESGGKMEVRLYPGGQLGNERELIEGLKLGSVDLIVTGLAIIGWYAPEYGAFEAPFLWRDYAHVEQVWNGAIGEEVRRVMQKKSGARLMQPWFRGPRYLTTTSRKVLTLDDLKGLKLRVPELEIYIKSWQAFGANVTPVPFTDIFMALKLGVVEGQENPLATIYANHLQEVQRYIMETRHLISFYVPSIGPNLERRFTPEECAVLLGALDATTRWHNQEVERAEAGYRQKLEADGAEFVAIDPEPFRALARERIPLLFEKLWKPGLYQQISESR